MATEESHGSGLPWKGSSKQCHRLHGDNDLEHKPTIVFGTGRALRSGQHGAVRGGLGSQPGGFLLVGLWRVARTALSLSVPLCKMGAFCPNVYSVDKVGQFVAGTGHSACPSMAAVLR